MKAAEKASKAAEKAASKAAAASKAGPSKKGQTKKTGLSQVLEEQAQAEMEATIAAEDAEQAQIEASGENNREVIYIRYDDTNMKYVYLCVHCDTTWRTDNRL
jgi:DNA-directed RNA polymerase subunit M/transcription elongation factor TFIIS